MESAGGEYIHPFYLSFMPRQCTQSCKNISTAWSIKLNV